MRQFGEQYGLVDLPLDRLHEVVGKATHLDAVCEGDIAVISFAKDLRELK